MIDLAAFEGRRIPAGVGRAALWGAAALCAVSLAWAAAPVIWHLTGESGLIIPAPATAQDKPATRTDLGPLLAFEPFGQDDMPVPEPQVTDRTDLGLTLLGVTIGNPPSASRAIISGGVTPVASYPIGARITANVDLAEVNADHVVLRVDGQLETLSFAKRSEVAARAAGNNLRDQTPPVAPPQPATPSDPPGTPEEEIARYREALRADAGGLLDRLGVIPTSGGYRIGDDASAEVLQAGMRPGDVITSVNGRQVGDIVADQQHFDEVAVSGQARVELLRDGQPIVMSFLFR